MNKAILIGNLGQDPELKQLSTGISLATVSLATNKSYKNRNGERVTETEWHNLKLWGPTAEAFCKFFSKGDTAIIEGEIRTESWESHGEMRYKTVIVVNEWLFVPRAKSSEGDQQAEQRQQKAAPQAAVPASSNNEEDDLPF